MNRHDAVLSDIVGAITQKLPLSTTLTVDNYMHMYVFPLHIPPTSLRPHFVWCDNAHRSSCLVELTVNHDSNFNEAA